MKSKFPKNEPIAIVGMSCRFPNSNSLDEFWDLLKNKKSTISTIPKSRWDMQKYNNIDIDKTKKVYQKHASLLSDIHHFDPLFFNISPAEAIEMSPSQKLMLELAWESFENSTIPFDKIQGQNVGVFVGSIWSDFEHLRKQKNAKATLHSAVGMSNSVVANRVSFAFGFSGPSLVVDTGCSSSLVALHMACNSIRSGESEYALVGGINHILDPDKYVELTQFGGLSKKGLCSSFDNDADGFVRGEGGGVLFLKPLSKAEEDGDKILALIKGTAVNNNGFNGTLPATSVEAQKDLLKSAYKNSGVKPEEVDYVEAHGTGTKLGDPNEARAIGEFFKENRIDNHLRLGSVKTNIGHTEATAGIAGIIKVVLSMQNSCFVPNLNFNTPNSEIPFEALKLKVQEKMEPWVKEKGETFKAGVNSFGWGGTNSHAVLEQYIENEKEEIELDSSFLLPISGQSTEVITAYAKEYLLRFENKSDKNILEICQAVALLKPEFDHKKLFFGESSKALITQLELFISEEEEVASVSVDNELQKVAFVFPGQGGQWLGMGRELLRENKVFRDTIELCEKAFKPYVNWSLMEELTADQSKSRLKEINVVQPVICAVQIALAKVWQSLGIIPDAVVGHSMGEVAAANIAGVLSLEDAAKVICTRSKLMRSVSGKGGAMIVTELTADEAGELNYRYAGKVSFAVNNSPKSTVLSGDEACIKEILADLERRDLFCRMINVDVASHSPQMDPLIEPLKKELSSLDPQNGSIDLVSTVEDKGVKGRQMNADYWAKNLRNTVRFSSAMDGLLTDDFTIFIEMSSHPTLLNAMNDCASSRRIKTNQCASIVRDEPEINALLKNIAVLYENGYVINWRQFLKLEKAPHVSLPGYPYQREAYEIEDLSIELDTVESHALKFPLLGVPMSLAGLDDYVYWQNTITDTKFAYLTALKEKGNRIMPLFMELVLESAAEIFGDIAIKNVVISNLKINNELNFPKDDRFKTQLKAKNGIDGTTFNIQVYIKGLDADKWQLLGATQLSYIENQKAVTPVELELNYLKNRVSIAENVGAVTNTVFPIKVSAEMCLGAKKYILHPSLLADFLGPLFSEMKETIGSKSLNIDFTTIEHFAFHGEADYEHDLHGLMVIRELKEDAEKWHFQADFIIANHNDTTVFTIEGIKGVCSEKELPVVVEKAGEMNIRKHLMVNYLRIEHEEKSELLQQVLIENIAKIIKMPASRIKGGMTFKGMGLDSLMSVQLRGVVEKEFNISLSVSLFKKYPSVNKYTGHLVDLLDERMSTDQVNNRKKGTKSSNWFSIPKPNENAAYRLFCFHDAGGSSALFEPWDEVFENEEIELVLIEMPGHGRRVQETPMTSIENLLKPLMPELIKKMDKPFAFFGHSMGGLIAFNAIRELQKRHLPEPLHLFISSTPGLNSYDKSDVDYQLSDHMLIHRYPHLKKSTDQDVQKQQISILRADLQLIHNYDYKKGNVLDFPITAIHGSEDKTVKYAQMEEWAKETVSSFRIYSRSGGHAYIQSDTTYVTTLIKETFNSETLLKKIG